VNRHRHLCQLATIGALALALLVAGCGLKGPLEKPPAAAATPGQQAQVDGEPQQQPENDKSVPVRKRVFLDWLLD
jgi:predicted small lipoprotein YifL